MATIRNYNPRRIDPALELVPTEGEDKMTRLYKEWLSPEEKQYSDCMLQTRHNWEYSNISLIGSGIDVKMPKYLRG